MARWLLFVCFTWLYVNCNSQDERPFIRFEGLKKTKESYLKRTFYKQYFSAEDTLFLKNQLEFLKRMPAFANASYLIKKSPERDTLIYTLEESWTLLPDINFQNADGQTNIRLGFQEFNFLGQGILLKPAMVFNGKASFFFEADVPYLIGNIGFHVKLGDIKSDEPFYLDDTTTTFFEVNNTMLEFFVNWNLNYSNRIEIGAGTIDERFVRLIPGEMDMQSQIPTELDYSKYSFTGSYIWNKLIYDYYLIDGMRNDFRFFKVVDKNAPDVYNEFRNQLTYFKNTKNDNNWAFRLQTAMSTNNGSPLAPFVIDSQLNFRGVGDREDRATGTLVLNAEYRHGLFDGEYFAAQAVGFTDAGTVRRPGEDFSTEIRDLRFHIGLGGRIIFKKAFNSVLRVDYGWGLDRLQQQGLVIGLGQYF